MSSTIIRAPRRKRFLIIDQRIIEDTRLSWASRGLLAYLLSRPDNWKVLIKDLQNRGDLGRDGIYSLLKELRRFGYVHYRPTRDDQGRLRGGVYTVWEIPVSPHPPRPETGKPNAARPSAARPDAAQPEALVNTEKYLRTIPVSTDSTKQRSPARRDKKAALEIVAWMPNEIRAEALSKVAEIESPFDQMLIDEWTDAIAQGSVVGTELAYLDALLNRLSSSEFRQKSGR